MGEPLVHGNQWKLSWQYIHPKERSTEILELACVLKAKTNVWMVVRLTGFATVLLHFGKVV
jgi:hypothetical protein